MIPADRVTGSAPAFLLTGRPAVGKTTVLVTVASALGRRAGGFYTREVRIGRKRAGFEIVTLDGDTAWLAAKDPPIPFARSQRLGSYRVNLDAIDALAVPSMLDALTRGQVVVVDEIGPMEILSPRFRDAILSVLESDVAVIGTVVLRPQPPVLSLGEGFADRVKAHPRVTVRHITRDNRDSLPDQILSELARR